MAQLLACTSPNSCQISLSDANSNAFVFALKHRDPCSICFSSDGNILAAIGFYGLRLFDLTSRCDFEIIDVDFINSALGLSGARVLFSNNGLRLLFDAGVDLNRVLHYVDLADRTILWSTSSDILCPKVAFTADDAFIVAVVATPEIYVALIDATTGKIALRVSLEGVITVLHLALSDDQQTIVTCGDHLHLWNLQTSQSGRQYLAVSLRGELRGHDNMVVASAFLGDGDRIVTASFDRTVKVWNTMICEELHTIRFDHVHPEVLSFCAQLNRIACGCSSNQVKIFDADTYVQVGTIENVCGPIAYSPSTNVVLL